MLSGAERRSCRCDGSICDSSKRPRRRHLVNREIYNDDEELKPKFAAHHFQTSSDCEVTGYLCSKTHGNYLLHRCMLPVMSECTGKKLYMEASEFLWDECMVLRNSFGIQDLLLHPKQSSQVDGKTSA
nr:uncharacterized protein LOC117860097 [Setaria viridis]